MRYVYVTINHYCDISYLTLFFFTLSNMSFMCVGGDYGWLKHVFLCEIRIRHQELADCHKSGNHRPRTVLGRSPQHTLVTPDNHRVTSGQSLIFQSTDQ